MPRILQLTSGPADWQRLLADPEKHWAIGYSARALAHCWEAADGFPPEVAAAFSGAGDPLLAGLQPILAVPEFKVRLPGGDRPSQNDIFVLARSAAGPVTIMVEGKVDESFGPTLAEWRADASAGKEERLRFLLRVLDLPSSLGGSIRYQLLHRAASALLEAESYRAVAGVMLVHSFSAQRTGWSDYAAFLNFFGVSALPGQIQRLSSTTSAPFFSAWVAGDLTFADA